MRRGVEALCQPSRRPLIAVRSATSGAGPDSFAEPKSISLAPGLGQHDVGRLEITMRDAHLVGLGQRIGNLHRNGDRLLRGQRAFDQLMLQRLALDQFHDQKVHPVLMTDVMEGANVGMRES